MAKLEIHGDGEISEGKIRWSVTDFVFFLFLHFEWILIDTLIEIDVQQNI